MAWRRTFSWLSECSGTAPPSILLLQFWLGQVCKVNTLERMERILAMEAAISFGARHPNVVTTYVYAVTHKKQLWKHKKDQGYGDLATGKQKQADLTEPDIPTLGKIYSCYTLSLRASTHSLHRRWEAFWPSTVACICEMR